MEISALQTPALGKALELTMQDLLSLHNETILSIQGLREDLDVLRDAFTFPGNVVTARVTVPTAGIIVPLLNVDLIVRRVLIQALVGNTNPVTVGTAGVSGATITQSGIALAAYDTLELKNINLSSLWLDAQTNGEGVVILYVA